MLYRKQTRFEKKTKQKGFITKHHFTNKDDKCLYFLLSYRLFTVFIDVRIANLWIILKNKLQKRKLFLKSLSINLWTNFQIKINQNKFTNEKKNNKTKQTPKNEAVLCCQSKIVYGTDKVILNITLVTVTQKWVTCWIYWVKANESYSFILDNLYSFDLLTFFFDEIKKKSRYRNFWRIFIRY